MNGPSPLPAPIVLLVDDEPLVQDLLHTALDDAGFGVVLANSDEEAFAALDAEGARNFAGVITDVNLRCPRSGWDIARHARELSPELPLLYVTGDSEREWVDRGVPCSMIIPKPFQPDQVVMALATLINKPGSDL